MADSRVTISYIHPPNHQDSPTFGNVGLRRVIFRVDCDFTSDQTALTDETLLDISELKTASGATCARTKVEWVKWGSMAGGTLAFLEWDRAPQVTIASSGPAQHGGVVHLDAVDESDGGVGDGTGDILLTVPSPSAADRFSFSMSVRLKDAK